MRQAVQLEEEGEGGNIAAQLKSLKAAVWANDVHGVVLDGISLATCGARGTHLSMRGTHLSMRGTHLSMRGTHLSMRGTLHDRRDEGIASIRKPATH